jgi:8-oxo-dGTP pyrophosphatase MutT (NUDIX family)
LTDVPIRDAATVALLRDGGDGIEVFMLKRASTLVFSPSAHVFPGGALDEEDRAETITQFCTEPSPSPVPLAFYVAALREAYEEAGLLLAYTAGGGCVRFDEPDTASRFAVHRKNMHAGELTIEALCDREQLRLAVDALVPFGHWVTPKGAPRRFDTRFFAARAPEHQEASSDGFETTEGLWTRPVDVLAANDAGDVELILPTRRSLERLGAFDTVDDALGRLAAG